MCSDVVCCIVIVQVITAVAGKQLGTHLLCDSVHNQLFVAGHNLALMLQTTIQSVSQKSGSSAMSAKNLSRHRLHFCEFLIYCNVQIFF